MQPFFSIIVPTLNEEKFLPKLLSDLAAQKEKNFEVIIVDGKSDDKTKQVATGYTTIDLSFHEVTKRNVSVQKNFGANKAKGTYLIFLDADSRVSQTFSKRAESMIRTKKGLIFLPYVDPEENSPEMKALYKGLNFLIDASQSTNKPLSSVGCMIFEKQFFTLIGGFNEEVYIAEDWSIMQKASGWGVHGRFLPQLKVKFSFRRIKKEGRLKSIYKLIMGTFHVIFKGPVKEKIFEYEMGGHLYDNKTNTKSPNQTIERVKEEVVLIQKKFKKLLNEE